MSHERDTSLDSYYRRRDLSCIKGLDGHPLPLRWNCCRSPHVAQNTVKVPDDTGWEGIWSYHVRVRHTPDCFRHFVHRLTGLSPGDSASSCSWNRSKLLRSSSSDFVLGILWKDPAHRSRMRTLSHNSVLSWSMMKCPIFAFLLFNSTVLSRCSRTGCRDMHVIAFGRVSTHTVVMLLWTTVRCVAPSYHLFSVSPRDDDNL